MATNSFSKESHLFTFYFSTNRTTICRYNKLMTIKAIQEQLFKGEKTSVQLVEEIISKHLLFKDKNPIALISPLALSIAKQRDQERKLGKSRGPLHGIPVLIKDNILFADGTPTTANSFALKDFIPTTNAPLIDGLISAGAIIVGKANLSEFAYFMGDENMPSGYGSMYGQVKHPVDESIDPLGSSTGSAVAVALGIVSLAIGTETNGSLMAPAFQNQIISFKPTKGMISTQGIIPISPSQDTAGPMATSVEDCATLMDAMSLDQPKDLQDLPIQRPSSFLEFIHHPLGQKQIGIITFDQQPYDAIDQNILEQTTNTLKKLGHAVKHIRMSLPKLDNYPTLLREFKVSMNTFLAQHTQEGCPASLAKIIAINDKHPERCLKYGQATLIASEAMPATLDQEFKDLRLALQKEAAVFQTCLQEENLDAAITPTWLSFAPIYGNPSLCIPMGYHQNKPKGIVLVAKFGHDAEVLQLGYQLDEYLKESN
jgi:amidase